MSETEDQLEKLGRLVGEFRRLFPDQRSEQARAFLGAVNVAMRLYECGLETATTKADLDRLLGEALDSWDDDSKRIALKRKFDAARSKAGAAARHHQAGVRQQVLALAMKDTPRSKGESDGSWRRRLEAYLKKHQPDAFNARFRPPVSRAEDNGAGPRLTRDAVRRAAGSKPRR